MAAGGVGRSPAAGRLWRWRDGGGRGRKISRGDEACLRRNVYIQMYVAVGAAAALRGRASSFACGKADRCEISYTLAVFHWLL